MGATLDMFRNESDGLAYAAGQGIFSKGDEGKSMYVVLEGEVDLRIDGVLVETLGPGEPFGEMAALDGSPRSASATAIEDTELLRIGSDEFYEVLHEQVEIAEGIIRTLIARLRVADAALEASSGRPSQII